MCACACVIVRSIGNLLWAWVKSETIFLGYEGNYLGIESEQALELVEELFPEV